MPAALIVNIWKINCTCQKTLSRQMLQFLFKMQDQNMYHQLLYFETLQTLPKIKFMTQSHKLKLKNRLWGFIYVDKNRLFLHHSHLRRKNRKIIWKRWSVSFLKGEHRKRAGLQQILGIQKTLYFPLTPCKILHGWDIIMHCCCTSHWRKVGSAISAKRRGRG